MKHYKLLVIAAAALLLGSCQEKENPVTGKQPIRFTTNLGAFTKATDTNFEEGDEVSLFAEDPINALNVKMVFHAGELIPETPICWQEGQPASEQTSFYALYPYREDWQDLTDLSVFSVNADQRTPELYAASDLLGASYMAYPDCSTIPLNFTHRLSRVIVSASVSGLSKKIVDVYLKGVFGKVRVAVFHGTDVYCVGDKGTVRTGCREYQQAGWSGEPYSWSEWYAIVPPQDFDFSVVAVMDDGSQYEFSPAEWSNVTMESAKSYTASFHIDATTATAQSSISVDLWTDDNDAQFGTVTPDKYHTEGDWLLVNKTADSADYLSYDYFKGAESFKLGFTPEAGAQYDLLYINGRNETRFGLANGGTVGDGFSASFVEGGRPFTFDTTEEYVLSVDPYNNTLSVKVDNDVWSIVGDFGDEPWNTDIDMTRVSYGLYNVEFESFGQEFKLRANHDWEMNFGSRYTIMQNGYRYPLDYDGQNIALAEAGRYLLELNVVKHTLAVRLQESYVSEENFNECIGDWVFQNGDNPYSVSVYDYGYPDCMINYDDWQMMGSFDTMTGKIKVSFQRVDEFEYGNYGLLYIWLYADTEAGDDYYGEDSSVPLFYLEKTADGNIEVTPAKYNGNPFLEFGFLAVQPENGYKELGFFDYGLPLPQTWTPAN